MNRSKRNAPQTMRPAVAALGLLLAGCAQATTEDYVNAFEAMSRVIKSHESDCEHMAKALRRFADTRHGAAIRSYYSRRSQPRYIRNKELSGTHYIERIEEATTRLLPGHERCKTHDSVREALELL